METVLTLNERVWAELEKLRSPKSNPVKNIITLVITIAAFAFFGMLVNSVQGILAIIVVLLVHEAGHMVGMKLYGYRDVQMFFIPMLGAAVSGVDEEPRSDRQAVVSLLGPVPGILIGVGLGVAFIKTGNPLYKVGSQTFLFINGFNLLPFFPLDGGRFFNSLFFARGARVELVFKIITALILGAVALFLQAYFLVFFVLVILLGTKASYTVAKVAQEVRPEDSGNNGITQKLDEDFVSRLSGILTTRIESKKDDPKFIAKTVLDIWERVNNVRASRKATFGLVTIYLLVALTTLISPLVFLTLDTRNEITKRIEIISNDDGTSVTWEYQYYKEQLISSVTLDNDGFYHGEMKTWKFLTGKTDKVGFWTHGYWNGIWEHYKDEEIIGVVDYKMGVPVRYAEVKDGSLRWLKRDDWPLAIKTEEQNAPAPLP